MYHPPHKETASPQGKAVNRETLISSTDWPSNPPRLPANPWVEMWVSPTSKTARETWALLTQTQEHRKNPAGSYRSNTQRYKHIWWLQRYITASASLQENVWTTTVTAFYLHFLVHLSAAPTASPSNLTCRIKSPTCAPAKKRNV